MLSKLLRPEVVSFINKQKKKKLKLADFDRLLFNKTNYPNIPIELVVDQLKARQKAKKKLPLWYNTQGVVMPPLLSMEQSSSEQAAKYKSKLAQGNLAIDLTGGTGVDSYYLSKQFKKVVYIDYNKDLTEIAAHNFKLLGASNIEVVHANSEEPLTILSKGVDCVCIDPARRNKEQKVFLFEECSPNILSIQETLLKRAQTIIVKASPMLDIAKGIAQLINVAEVHVIAIKNEVKELLFIQKKQKQNDITIFARDLEEPNHFTSLWSQKEDTQQGELSAYLYEPNAAILKTGKSDNLASCFNLAKLNKNTHLYTSNRLEEDFPGRKFKVEKILKYDKKEIRRSIPTLQANIAVRNFTDTVDEIRKKTGINPGGLTYLFGIRDIDNKPKVLICSKI
ncbi:hypothetical protein MNBD_BACTEROID06-295 [hydrothermal vent metagenome]|uniref:Uncharacterized protein n=1 Tax=hydrothermal vent metagenome TaxID=652676 RepID=A0A3B0V2Z1_9ZZZZ